MCWMNRRSHPKTSSFKASCILVRGVVLIAGRLAQDAGLEWVQSDASKVRAVQDAIANEPPPVRVPRTIKPVVLVDDGPLILVETRRDLSELKLPFEQIAEAEPATDTAV